MEKYINRLERCGYSRDYAKKLCIDFITNLSLFDLECFVWYVEKI